MNRDEYRNTIRDLTGVEFDVSSFPLDPLADGFDNNGKALTVSPMLMEMYINAAQKIVDRESSKAANRIDSLSIEPEVGDGTIVA